MLENKDGGSGYKVLRSCPVTVVKPTKEGHKIVLPRFKLKVKKPPPFSNDPFKDEFPPKRTIRKVCKSQENSLILPEMEAKSSDQKAKGMFGKRHFSLGRNENKLLTGKAYTKKKVMGVLAGCQKLLTTNLEMKEKEAQWMEKMIEKIDHKSTRNSKMIREIINYKLKAKYKRELELAKSGPAVSTEVESEFSLQEKREQKMKKLEGILKAFDYVDEDLKKAKGDLDLFFPKDFTKRSIGYYQTDFDQVELRERFELRVRNSICEAEAIKENAATHESDKTRQRELAAKFEAAVKVNNVQLVKEILETNPELVHNKFSLRQTALHIASKMGHNETVAVLLENGAQIKTKDFLGRTCIDIAVSHKRLNTAGMLERWLKL